MAKLPGCRNANTTNPCCWKTSFLKVLTPVASPATSCCQAISMSTMSCVKPCGCVRSITAARPMGFGGAGCTVCPVIEGWALVTGVGGRTARGGVGAAGTGGVLFGPGGGGASAVPRRFTRFLVFGPKILSSSSSWGSFSWSESDKNGMVLLLLNVA